MKIAVLIARILLGLVFVVFGFNGFVPFMPEQLPPGLAGQFLTALIQSHYILAICAIYIIGGALLLLNRYLILGLVLLAPIVVNIFLFHAFLAPSGLPLAVVVVILWALIAIYYRRHLACLFVQKADA